MSETTWSPPTVSCSTSTPCAVSAMGNGILCGWVNGIPIYVWPSQTIVVRMEGVLPRLAAAER